MRPIRFAPLVLGVVLVFMGVLLAPVLSGPVLSASPTGNATAAAGRAPCSARQQLTPQGATTVNLGISADNDYAVYLGDCCTVGTLVGAASCNVTNACIRAGQAFTITGVTGSSYLYVVAWSDHATAQGLVASVGPGPATSTPPNEILTGDPRWQVFATSVTFPGTPPATDNTTPPTKKFLKTLRRELDVACSQNLWTTPVNGASNASGNNVAGAGTLEPTVNVVDPNALWIWFQSNQSSCAGPQSPFSPGCNHNEYLIFRLPLSYVM